MKKSRICPKCQSNDIVCVQGNIGAYGSGNNITLYEGFIHHAVPVTKYICCNCGFVEEWVKKEYIEKIRKGKWTHTL